MHKCILSLTYWLTFSVVYIGVYQKNSPMQAHNIKIHVLIVSGSTDFKTPQHDYESFIGLPTGIDKSSFTTTTGRTGESPFGDHFVIHTTLVALVFHKSTGIAEPTCALVTVKTGALSSSLTGNASNSHTTSCDFWNSTRAGVPGKGKGIFLW